MNIENNIFILGDSTSMTVGCENFMYPYYLRDMVKWKKNLKIKNYSLAGNTSSDIASIFYSKIKNKIKCDDVLILYLGNCDSASSEIIKGKYSFFQHLKNRFKVQFNFKTSKTKIKNKLNYFSWNNKFDPDIEMTMPSKVYKYNLKKIIKVCKKKSCKVILIKPLANEKFLPGVGKGNFIFH